MENAPARIELLPNSPLLFPHLLEDFDKLSQRHIKQATATANSRVASSTDIRG